MAKDIVLQRVVLKALAQARPPIHGVTFNILLVRVGLDVAQARALDRELQRLRKAGQIEYRSPVIGWSLTALGRTSIEKIEKVA